MVASEDDFQRFLAWIQAFDEQQLTNEAEVETKFVLPLFASLGYPDECRRPQYSLKGPYVPGRSGNRSTRIDQIYFSAKKQDEQTPDTALVIVEAKAPNITDLDDAIEQARFYGDRMAPLILVIANGIRLLIIKRQRYRSDEIILDTSLRGLRDPTIARQVFDQLHFGVLTRLKAELIDPTTHAQYVALHRAMEGQPDLQAQLQRGDFRPRTTQEGRHLTVIRPKVAIECELPLAYGDGSCRISFSSLLLRGLTCHLTHRQILETLLTGLGTPAAWGTRRFLQREESADFVVHLGQTAVILSAGEADNLCNCVDDIGHQYLETIVAAEDTLETWDYLLRYLPGYGLHGFDLLEVDPWLWELMHRFAREHDFLHGTSPWHIFDANKVGFRIMTGRDVVSAKVYPYFGSPDMPTRAVDVLYCIDKDEYLVSPFDDENAAAAVSWKGEVGPQGRWTAPYTERWLLERFIPHVLAHYKRQVKRGEEKPYQSSHVTSDDIVPLAEVSTPRQFSPYLDQIQSWFHVYGDCQIPAASLRPLYAALTNVVQGINAATIAPRYVGFIYGYVLGATQMTGSQTDPEPPDGEQVADVGDEKYLEEPDEEASAALDVINILSMLREHVSRIQQVDYEAPLVADYLCCAFIALVEDGDITCTQQDINATREALRPLLAQCRFEERYVLRPHWE